MNYKVFINICICVLLPLLLIPCSVLLWLVMNNLIESIILIIIISIGVSIVRKLIEIYKYELLNLAKSGFNKN